LKEDIKDVNGLATCKKEDYAFPLWVNICRVAEEMCRESADD
jgi:hypothetical protein